jgi:phytanoyl-CoA hydroxylase
MNSSTLTPEEINRRLYPPGKIATPIRLEERIAEPELRFYREQGYLAVENFLGEAEIEEAKAAIMDIITAERSPVKIQFTRPKEELKTPEEKEWAIRKVYQFVEHDERLRAVAFHAKLLSWTRQLLGEAAKLAQDQALLKPPFGGGEKPWHQDMAYGNLAYDKAVIGAWIALDDAGLDNGCMHVIPRSHMEGGTPHYAVRDWQICDTNVAVDKAVAVPLKPGGVLLFHGLLHHGTPFNFSSKRRRSLQFHYAPVSAEKLAPGEYKRLFTNAMTGAEC